MDRSRATTRSGSSRDDTVTIYMAARNVASRRPLARHVVGVDGPDLPRFARQREPLTALPSGSLADTFVHPHGLFRNVLVTGPLAVVGSRSVGGREAILVRSEHPRASKVLVDRPDRSIEVGIDRQFGFLLMLSETIADRVTRHAEVTRARRRPGRAALGLRSAPAGRRPDALLNDLAQQRRPGALRLGRRRSARWSPTTTTSGAGRSTTSSASSRCSAWKVRRPASRGPRSCAAAKATGRRTRASMPRAWPPGTTIARHSCWPTPRIIRNRAKVRAFRDNAIAVLRLREEEGGLDGLALVGRRRDAHRQPLRAPGRAAGSHRALGANWRAPLRPAASASWAPSSSTPTCSRSASSTTTCVGCFRHPESASGDAAASLGWTGQSNPPLPA